MTLQTKLLIALSVLVIGFGYAIVRLYQYIEDQKAQIAATQMFARQNDAGLRQQLQQVRDSNQILALQVSSLNTDKSALQKKNTRYIAMTESLKLYIDSMSIRGKGIARDGEDSVGKYSEVTFEGYQSFIRYAGFTRRYDKSSSFGLDLFPDIIDIYSDVIRDSDNLWKIRVQSRTPGVKLKVYSVFDSTLFMNCLIPPPPLPPPAFEISLNGGIQSSLSGALALSPDIEMQYTRRYYVRYAPLQKWITGGIRVTLLEF